ncbi:hypothetical protein BOX15_Mlig017197g2 [Macrostomum lignano]|uniref:Zeta_toxin domain-containing protein n=2 Tax=Macrostomum lignano TaxID=282301 RepID=A0A1I8HW30_9PLAT|nr:hypothetical protein BOX15_Mlig017197g2 [Macrostomum lignano]
MADPPDKTNSYNSFIPDSTGAMVLDDEMSQQVTLNVSMQQCLAQANSEGRLISGFKNVFTFLENNSSELILFCILPENLWNDSRRKAAFRLVASFCDERRVRMIKVDDDQLVRKIIERTSSSQLSAGKADLSFECVLVLRRWPDQPCCDAELLRHHARFPGHDFDNLPLVRLLESS